jgi:predicted DNA-binding protein (MmcQ/YjbR family)
MDLEIIREHCLKKKGVTEESPFGTGNPVYKVLGKIFLIASLTPPLSINLKCAPENAIELRERYPEVTPGYHMNKTHWNTVRLDGTVPDKLILEWVDHSYELVASKLKKSERDRLENL